MPCDYKLLDVNAVNSLEHNLPNFLSTAHNKKLILPATQYTHSYVIENKVSWKKYYMWHALMLLFLFNSISYV